MNIHLNQIVELAKIDLEIDSFEPRIESVKEEVNRVSTQKSELSNRSKDIEDEIRDANLRIQKNEIHLEELAIKLESINNKHKLIKSDKELKSLNLEEDITKEQITYANEEIAKFDKIKESKNEELLEIQQRSLELDGELKKYENDVSKELESIELERECVFKRKDELIQKMDQKVFVFYQKVRRWAGNESVVPTIINSDGNSTIIACGGCHLSLNNKTFDSIKKSDEIVTCQHCGRILYFEPPKESEEE